MTSLSEQLKLALERLNRYLPDTEQVGYNTKDIKPIHAALIECVSALEMGAFHHDACPWLSGKECCCAHEKVDKALSALQLACAGEGGK